MAACCLDGEEHDREDHGESDGLAELKGVCDQALLCRFRFLGAHQERDGEDAARGGRGEDGPQARKHVGAHYRGQYRDPSQHHGRGEPGSHGERSGAAFHGAGLQGQGDGDRGARREPPQDASQEHAAARAPDTDREEGREGEPADEHDGDEPELARVPDPPRTVILVGKKGQDHRRDHREREGRAQLLVAHRPRDTFEALLRGQEHRDRDPDRGGHDQRARAGDRADPIRRERCGLGGGSDRLLGARPPVGHERERRHREESGDDSQTQLARDHGEARAEKREEGEGADAGEHRLAAGVRGALPLHPDQAAQESGDKKPEQRGAGIGDEIDRPDHSGLDRSHFKRRPRAAGGEGRT